MTDEQRQELIRLLRQGEDIAPEWARILFPPEKREYELVYHGKEREEDILANTLAVPLQPVRTFGKNSEGWHNKALLDEVFGESNFINEIIWKRQSAHSDTKQGSAHYGRLHDTVLFYARGPKFIWNPQYEEYDGAYLKTF